MRASIGTGILLMAVGGVLAFAFRAPAEIEEYVDVVDLGLILVWSGVLVLLMQAVMHRPRRPRAAGRPAYQSDEWYERDVHRPGYQGETRRLPTVRGDGGRRH